MSHESLADRLSSSARKIESIVLPLLGPPESYSSCEYKRNHESKTVLVLIYLYVLLTLEPFVYISFSQSSLGSVRKSALKQA